MVGFGDTGGLGGLGGFGASYPTRQAAPVSRTVSAPLDFASGADWLADWQYRWDNPTRDLIKPVEMIPGHPDYNAADAREYQGDVSNSIQNWVFQKLGVDPTADYAQDFAKNFNFLKGTVYETGDPTGMSSHKIAGPKTGQVEWIDPDHYTRLEAEREAMLPRYDALDRQNQAYSVMSGGHQLNGLLGADYARPNFGQISGTTGPANPADITGAGQGSDVFQPGETYTAPRTTPRGWGFR